MRIPFILCLVILFAAFAASAQVPQYEAYPTGKLFDGKNAKPVITKFDRNFRTRIKWAADGKRDFAGEYIFTQFGCGMACRVTFILNARTGRVFWLPFTLCCWEPLESDPVAFRLDSRLLALRGLRNEALGEYQDDKATDVHFYEFKNGRFRFIKTVRSQNH